MRKILLSIFVFSGFVYFQGFAQAPNLPVKEALSESLSSGYSFGNATQVDTLLKQHPVPDAFTLEVVAKVNSATGRGLDIEARNARLKGFRLSLSAASLNWTTPLASSFTLSAARQGSDQTIRIAVRRDSAHIYHNGAYLQSQTLSEIKDIVNGTESNQLSNIEKGPALIPNWAGTAPNNMGRPSDYGWAYNNATTTTLFNVANGSGGARYMDINASSGGNVHTDNGSAYSGRVLYIRWDGTSYQNAVYTYPVTLEANSTYDFSMLHAYVSNATGSRTITVGIGKTTAVSGRIALKVFSTSGTRVLNRESFVFTSQEAGIYYLSFTGNWALYSIAELSLNKVNVNSRFIFGKNYLSGAVDMKISSVKFEEGAYAPATIMAGPRQSATLSGDVAHVPATFDTDFIVPGKTDVHLTAEFNPLINSTVDLLSDDSWLFFDNIKPSVVMASFLNKVRINGQPASPNANLRIAIYRNGTAVIPNGNLVAAKALEIFTEPDLSGDSRQLEVDTYHNNLGTFDNSVRSFKLRRGYMATLASNADGSGFSRVFIANDDDLIVDSMPQGLQNSISFIRVFRWDWVSKKGKAGWSPAKINSTWYYDWNIGGNSAADYDYSAIRQNGGWPSWTDINNKKGVNHLLGFNEPDRPDQANMTVDQAIAQWPDLMKSGLRIGSPAPANPESSWITDFMSKCNQLNYRVDFVAIHCYWGGQTPQQWYSRLKNIYDRVKRPLWITEWNNGANWTTESWPADQASQMQKQLNDLKGILTVLDTASFVERYAIYDWVENKRAMVLADTLTPAGKYYAANKSAFAFNPQKEYVHSWKLISPAITSTINSDNYFRATLRWKDVNGEMGSKYVLERKIDGTDADFLPIYRDTSYTHGGTMSFVDSAFAKASYRIKAFGMNESSFAYSSVLVLTRDAAPTAPAALAGTVVSATKIKVSWTAASGARSYNLKRALSAEGPFTTILSRTTALEFLDENLSPATDYYYSVSSLNSAGESLSSTVLHLRSKELVAPDSVLRPRIASGDSRITLSWDFMYDVKYEISRSASESGPFEIFASDVDGLRFEDTTALNDEIYFYKIVAFNAAGSSQASPVLSGSPVFGQHLYISFDEDSGVVAQDAWGGYHGILGSTVTRDAGKKDAAVKLDGAATSYVSLQGSPVASLSDFTVSAWVRMDALSNWMRVFDFGSGTSKYMLLTAQANTSEGKSTVRYVIKNGGAEQQLNYLYAFPLNTWTHLAVSQSADTARLYINGDLVASSTSVTIKPADLGPTTQNYIGKSQYNDPLLKASVDEFRVYNYGLASAEINQLLNGEELKRPQTISFAAFESREVGDPDIVPQASASSKLPLSYSSSNPGIADIIDGKIRIMAAGIVTITASQPGDSIFKPAQSVSQQLSLLKKQQSIIFTALGSKILGEPDFSLTAQASSALPVSFVSSDTSVASVSGNIIRIHAPGTTIIKASQYGNFMYAAAPVVEQAFTVVADTVAPITPLNLAATLTDSTANLTWDPSSDFIGVVGYKVYKGEQYIGNTASLTQLVGALSASTSYTINVFAVDRAGNISEPASITVITPDTQVPSAPNLLTATKTQAHHVMLSWQESIDNVGVTGYDIYRNGDKLNIMPISGLSFETDRPVGNNLFEFSVKALDSAGNVSAPSNIVRVQNGHAGDKSQSAVIASADILMPVFKTEALLVYPNPSNGDFDISFSSREIGKISMNIYTSSGILVKSCLDIKQVADFEKSFKLQGLAAGSYILRLNVNGKILSKTLLIN